MVGFDILNSFRKSIPFIAAALIHGTYFVIKFFVFTIHMILRGTKSVNVT